MVGTDHYMKGLRGSFLAYSAVALVVTALVVAVVCLVPFYWHLSEGQKRELEHAVASTTRSIDAYVQRCRGVAAQIASRTQARSDLDCYNRGEMNLAELVASSTPKLADGLKNSAEAVGIVRFDCKGKPVVRVGRAIPEEYLTALPETERSVRLEGPITIDRESLLLARAPIMHGDPGAEQRIGTDVSIFTTYHLKGLLGDDEQLQTMRKVLFAYRRNGTIYPFFPGPSGEAAAISTEAPLGRALSEAFAGGLGKGAGTDAAGKNVLVRARSIDGHDWGLAVAADQAALYDPVRNRILFIGLILLILIPLGIVGSLLVLRPIAGRMVWHASELEDALASLRTSEATLRQIMDLVPHMIFAKNRQGRFILVNRATAEAYGMTPEDMVGVSHADLHPNEAEVEHYLRDDLAVIESGTPKFIPEETFLDADGRTRVLQTMKIPFGTLGSDWEAMLGVAVDITDLKKVEGDLRESEQKYFSLYNSMNEGVALNELVLNEQGVPADYVIRDVNPAYAALIGIAREELIGVRGSELYGSTPPPNLDTGARVTSSREPVSFQTYDPKMGKHVHVSVFAPREDMFATVFTDFSDQVQAEERTQHLNAVLRAVRDINQLIVRETDRTTMVKRACEMLVETRGYHAAWIILLDGSPPVVSAAGESTGDSLQALADRCREGALPECAQRALARNGLVAIQARGETCGDCPLLLKNEPLASMAVRLQHGDQVYGVLSIHSTVATSVDEEEIALVEELAADLGLALHKLAVEQEREELLKQYLQAQKMESMGRLAGGVAHDFNNQLTVILGYGDLLLKELAENDPSYTLVMEIKNAATRAQLVTSQLLMFGRRQVLREEIVNLNDVVNELRGPFSRIIGEHIELSVHTEDSPASVRVDRSQLEQAIMNLVVNAHDAMPDGGSLRLETATIEHRDGAAAGTITPGPYVKLTVSDTGVGMDAATRLRVFEPFFTTKEVGRGTGLGLSMTYGFVTKSGGSIDVASAPGTGTTVTILLPRVAVLPAVSRDETGSGSHPRGTETILVAEDDEAVRALVLRILRQCGYTVLEAADGREALDLAQEYPGRIDLLVTDVVMPGMSGVELADGLGRIRPRLAVLYVSGYAEETRPQREVVRRGGMLLSKPVRPEELARAVRHVLERRQG